MQWMEPGRSSQQCFFFGLFFEVFGCVLVITWPKWVKRNVSPEDGFGRWFLQHNGCLALNEKSSNYTLLWGKTLISWLPEPKSSERFFFQDNSVCWYYFVVSSNCQIPISNFEFWCQKGFPQQMVLALVHATTEVVVTATWRGCKKRGVQKDYIATYEEIVTWGMYLEYWHVFNLSK